MEYRSIYNPDQAYIHTFFGDIYACHISIGAIMNELFHNLK
jgi:hypothetical protein